MKLLTRFIGSSAIVAILVATLLGGNTALIRQAEDSVEASHDRTDEALETSRELQFNLEQQTAALKDYLLLDHSSADMEHYREHAAEFMASLEELERLLPGASEPGVVRQRYQVLTRLGNDLEVKGESTQAQAQQDVKSINSFKQDIDLYLNSMLQTIQQQHNTTKQTVEQFQQITRAITYGMIGLILLVFAGQFWLILLPVIQSIQKLQVGATKLGAGDLDYRLDIHTNDEIEQLATEFNQMAAKLADTHASLELQTEAANTANQAKSDFLANMSHELRTPLNGILGYTQVMQRDRSLNPKQQEGLDIIYQCGSHLLTLINDILDLSKIEAQKMELFPTDIHLLGFLQGVTEMCRIKAEQKQLAFTVQTDPNLPVGVQADEKRLRQVLINLLSNAIKFTDRGSVTFKVLVLGQQSFIRQEERRGNREMGGRGDAERKTDEGRSTQSGIRQDLLSTENGNIKGQKIKDKQHITKIRFQVEDTGVGMSPEHLKKIFLPFEQVGEQKQHSEGTGLGLAISQKIVQMMGSAIRVESELGRGSTFWLDVELPESKDWVQQARSIAEKMIVGYVGHIRKILVVDDKWENRSVIVGLLSAIGFEVTEAVDGQDGLTKAAQVNPDLIITDLLMPVMDGYELIKQLRYSPDFQDVIIIVSSASVFESDQYRSLRAGGNDFLPKPVQVGELLDTLQKYLQLEWTYEATTSDPVETAPVLATPAESSLLDSNSIAVMNMVTPPLEDLEILHRLSMRGNLKGILKEADRLEQLNPQLLPFVEQLRQLAKGFQEKKLQELISQHLCHYQSS